jgi:hypothetical protein
MDRFWLKVIRGRQEDCWPWTGAKDRDGYGKVGTEGRIVLAHRFSYEKLVGPIPHGLELDHLCRNPSCVNPRHLEPVTHKTNMSRGMHATKTRCKNGHTFNSANTYRHEGQRHCRRCNAQSAARSRERARA